MKFSFFFLFFFSFFFLFWKHGREQIASGCEQLSSEGQSHVSNDVVQGVHCCTSHLLTPSYSPPSRPSPLISLEPPLADCRSFGAPSMHPACITWPEWIPGSYLYLHIYITLQNVGLNLHSDILQAWHSLIGTCRLSHLSLIRAFLHNPENIYQGFRGKERGKGEY